MDPDAITVQGDNWETRFQKICPQSQVLLFGETKAVV